jgi:predicted RNase H-like HicB family nuclease
MKMSDRYLKIVAWSEEDQCYIGQCPTLFGGGVHGDNEAEVYKELCDVVEENVTLLQTDGHPLPPATAGKPYSC